MTVVLSNAFPGLRSHPPHIRGVLSGASASSKVMIVLVQVNTSAGERLPRRAKQSLRARILCWRQICADPSLGRSESLRSSPSHVLRIQKFCCKFSSALRASARGTEDNRLAANVVRFIGAIYNLLSPSAAAHQGIAWGTAHGPQTARVCCKFSCGALLLGKHVGCGSHSKAAAFPCCGHLISNAAACSCTSSAQVSGWQAEV